MTRRLALLDDDRMRLEPVNMRLIFFAWLLTLIATVAAKACGTWYVVRRDYIQANAIISEAIAQRDRLMQICVKSDEQMKQKVRRNVPQNIGGESQ